MAFRDPVDPLDCATTPIPLFGHLRPSFQFGLSPNQIKTNFKLRRSLTFRNLHNRSSIGPSTGLRFAGVRFPRLRKKVRRGKKGAGEIHYQVFVGIGSLQFCSSRSMAQQRTTNFLAKAVMAIFFREELPRNSRL